MKRIEAIEQIMQREGPECLYVTTDGYISREFYHLNTAKNFDCFYLIGSMGTALPVGIGLAMNTPKKVVVISGDAAVLMSLGSMVLLNHLKLANLKHYILDNGSHGSTGGQPTCSNDVHFTSLNDNTEVMVVERGNADVGRILDSPVEMKRRFMDAIKRDSSGVVTV